MLSDALVGDHVQKQGENDTTECCDDDRNPDGRGCFETCLKEIAHECTCADHSAMGEVTELQDTEDDGESNRYESVDRTETNSVD